MYSFRRHCAILLWPQDALRQVRFAGCEPVHCAPLALSRRIRP